MILFEMETHRLMEQKWQPGINHIWSINLKQGRTHILSGGKVSLSINGVGKIE